MTDGRLEQILDELRAQGGRVTNARRTVLQILLDDPGHISAEDLAARVQAEHPEVHLSTVYRSLDAFERLGVLTHVHLGHGRAIYHLTESLHHHAVCERCGAVVHLPPGVFDGVSRTLRRDHGFEPDAHHFAIVGRCRDCGAPAGR